MKLPYLAGLALSITLAAGSGLADPQHKSKPPPAPAVQKPKLDNHGVNESAIVDQIGHFLVASQTAVSCGIRTLDWRSTVMKGVVATTNMLFFEEDEDAQYRHVTSIFRAARIKAALDAKFDAPTSEQCESLKTSGDMKEMDASASIGMIAATVNEGDDNK